MAQERIQRWTLVKTVMNFRDSYKAENLLANLVTVIF
jgi:hypothetical protein